MSEDKEIPEILELDLDIQIERENNAVGQLSNIISEFNADEFKGYPSVEEALLFYLVTRMAALAEDFKGEDRYSRDYLLRHVKAAINTGKDIIEQGRRDGTLPRPFKLITPKGLH